MEYSEVALQQVRERRLLIDQVDLWLYDEVRPYIGQHVLEIGCGHGNFARHLVDRERYMGIDISPESVRLVQETLCKQPNMNALVADITDVAFTEKFPDHSFDTVISLNVFEHIENDVLAIQNARSVLRPGGVMILVVPSHQWLYGTMDRSIGHYRRYSKESLAVTFEHGGFTVEKQKYINTLGAVGWFINGRILRQSVPPVTQLRFLNGIIPLVKWMEQRVDAPFGTSVLTIARKTIHGTA